MKALTTAKQVITTLQLERLLASRESLDAMRQRYDLLEEAVRSAEQEMIGLIEAGAIVTAEYEVSIRSTERRYPAWKERYAVLAGFVPSAPSTEEVLANTPPTISKKLVIK